MDEPVGTRLREARTRRRLTIADAEEATKIRARYLRAIENEDWDLLPSEVYARAFIRTYGVFLGLDGERLAEEQRRSSGAARPGERLPRVDPRPRRIAPRRTSRGISPGLLAAVVSGLVLVALVIVGLSGGDESSDGGGGGHSATAKSGGSGATKGAGQTAAQPQPGHTLELFATGEVWVCLLDAAGEPLVEGRILAAGETEGPFRSGSFTLALGNGAVTMIVDGQRENLPEPPSPIGFAVDSGGSVREIPEGERPTCT